MSLCTGAILPCPFITTGEVRDSLHFIWLSFIFIFWITPYPNKNFVVIACSKFHGFLLNKLCKQEPVLELLFVATSIKIKPGWSGKISFKINW